MPEARDGSATGLRRFVGSAAGPAGSPPARLGAAAGHRRRQRGPRSPPPRPASAAAGQAQPGRRGELRVLRRRDPGRARSRGRPGAVHADVRLPGVLPAVHPLRRQAGPAGRYRSIPDRYLSDPARPLSAAEWDELEIPVGLAFFLRSSRWETRSPGSTRARREPRNAASTCRRGTGSRPPTRCSAAAAPDVEAVLISRGQDGVEYFLVPIDACYELAGRMRLLWRGFDGGSEARQSIAEFLDWRPVPRPGPSARSPDMAELAFDCVGATPTGTRWPRRCRSRFGSRRPAGRRSKRSRCAARSGSSRPGGVTPTPRPSA